MMTRHHIYPLLAFIPQVFGNCRAYNHDFAGIDTPYLEVNPSV